MGNPCILSRHVLYQFIDPGLAECFDGLGGVWAKNHVSCCRHLFRLRFLCFVQILRAIEFPLWWCWIQKEINNVLLVACWRNFSASCDDVEVIHVKAMHAIIDWIRGEVTSDGEILFFHFPRDSLATCSLKRTTLEGALFRRTHIHSLKRAGSYFQYFFFGKVRLFETCRPS